MRTHTGEKPFKCGHEGVIMQRLKKQSKKTHRESILVKNHLNVGMKGVVMQQLKKADLRIHMRTHTGEKPFKCDVEGCTFTTAYQSSLKTHIRISIEVKNHLNVMWKDVVM